jgi:hypothetical protein
LLFTKKNIPRVFFLVKGFYDKNFTEISQGEIRVMGYSTGITGYSTGMTQAFRTESHCTKGDFAAARRFGMTIEEK